MKRVEIIPSKDSALCIIVEDDSVEMNYSVLSVWFSETEVQDGDRGAIWDWSIVTYIGKAVGSSYQDDDCAPIWRGSYWRVPGDSELVMGDFVGFLLHAAEAPEDSDFLPQRVKEWAKTWEDLLELASIELAGVDLTPRKD